MPQINRHRFLVLQITNTTHALPPKGKLSPLVSFLSRSVSVTVKKSSVKKPVGRLSACRDVLLFVHGFLKPFCWSGLSLYSCLFYSKHSILELSVTCANLSVSGALLHNYRKIDPRSSGGVSYWTRTRKFNTKWQAGRPWFTRYWKNVVWIRRRWEGFLRGGEASSWAIENYTGWVHSESHSPKWRVLSKFSYWHCRRDNSQSARVKQLIRELFAFH